jgi:hypothetical protein
VLYERVTGIPPHVVQLTLLEELNAKVDALLPQFSVAVEQQLDSRTFNGVLSETRIRTLMEESNKGLHESNKKLLEELRRLRQQGRRSGWNDDDDNEPEEPPAGAIMGDGNFYLWLHSDGKLRRVPPDWAFPFCTASVLWEHWCCGDGIKKISPLRRMDRTDVARVKRGGLTFNDVKHLMGLIEDEAKLLNIYKKDMTRGEAKLVYEKCNNVLVLNPTKSGRIRCISTLKWPSLIRAMPKDQQKRQKRARYTN